LAIDRINQAIETYHFSEVAEALYDLLWRDLCDWYLEAIKPSLKDDEQQQRVLHTVLDAICRMLHPVCPFVTEAMWQHIHAFSAGSVTGIEMSSSDLAATASWPEASSLKLNQGEIESFELLRDLVGLIRVCRAENKVKPNRKIHLYASGGALLLAKKHEVVLSSIAGLEKIIPFDEKIAGVVIPFGSDRIMLGNLMDQEDASALCARLEQEIETLEKRVASLRGKLNNKGYIDNAPASVVEETREMLIQSELDLITAKEALEI
jgi:valyl-tRNA synthetase